jgi:hypothetical protein
LAASGISILLPAVPAFAHCAAEGTFDQLITYIQGTAGDEPGDGKLTGTMNAFSIFNYCRFQELMDLAYCWAPGSGGSPVCGCADYASCHFGTGITWCCKTWTAGNDAFNAGRNHRATHTFSGLTSDPDLCYSVVFNVSMTSNHNNLNVLTKHKLDQRNTHSPDRCGV